MKNSTRKNSSESKNVRGIIFLKNELKPLYITVSKWIEAGRPSNCFVYDNLQRLLYAQITIADAVNIEGRWIRLPELLTKVSNVPKIKPERSKELINTSEIEMVEEEFITPEITYVRSRLK